MHFNHCAVRERTGQNVTMDIYKMEGLLAGAMQNVHT